MSKQTTNLLEFIQNAFGSNATYVEGLLARYKTDPKLVDDAWQVYFRELLNGGAPSVEPGAQTTEISVVQKAPEPKTEVAKKPVPVPLSADTVPKPITGPAKKIVENMEQSLTVPTATSFRTSRSRFSKKIAGSSTNTCSHRARQGFVHAYDSVGDRPGRQRHIRI